MEEDTKTSRIYYFKETDSMDIWFFDEPIEEHVCEEVNDSILLKKNKDGDMIGIEIIT
ncbi:MAG: DUF2283 domain-containing protein [Candidatus Freyarchaeota archaeon]